MSESKQIIVPRGETIEVRDTEQKRHLLLSFPRIIRSREFRAFVARNAPLTDMMVVAHYQARPKKKSPEDEFYRVFGLYDTATQYYYARDDRYIQATAKFFVQMFSLDESLVPTVPTAVMVYFDARVRVEGDRVYIDPSLAEFSPDKVVSEQAVIWHGREPNARKITQFLPPKS